MVALGCPKQELFMRNYKRVLAPAVLLGIGASIDFIAGTQKRSPSWMSKAGLEWLHRLAGDPKRMAHRYLVRDRAIGGIFVRMMRTPKQERVFEG
jgi:N-acetylglucosaminyldiphosphoundecaprenol N-acetyl-beta-D-mannosaminyltransferase